MYQVILLSHGDLAKAMLESAQMLIGEHENVKAFGLFLGDDVESYRTRVTDSIEEALKERKVLVISDIQSGSPFNVAVGAMTRNDFVHITGMNLPMVVEALCLSLYSELDDVADELVEIGDKGVFRIELKDDDLEED